MQYARKLRKGDKVAEARAQDLKDAFWTILLQELFVRQKSPLNCLPDFLIKVIDNEELPIVYNVNFGHAVPRCALQYGVMAKIDMKQKKIVMAMQERLKVRKTHFEAYSEPFGYIGKFCLLFH